MLNKRSFLVGYIEALRWVTNVPSRLSKDDINQHIAMLEVEYDIELDGHDKVQIIRFIDDMSGKIEEEMGRWQQLRRKVRKTKSKTKKAK